MRKYILWMTWNLQNTNDMFDSHVIIAQKPA